MTKVEIGDLLQCCAFVDKPIEEEQVLQAYSDLIANFVSYILIYNIFFCYETKSRNTKHVGFTRNMLGTGFLRKLAGKVLKYEWFIIGFPARGCPT